MSERTCGHPECDRTLRKDNKSGFCQHHHDHARRGRHQDPEQKAYHKKYNNENRARIAEQNRQLRLAQVAADPKFERRRHLWEAYGMTLEDYDARVAAHDGKCPICRCAFSEENFNAANYPVVDHDHKTGLVRDVICRKCNGGLGMFGDDIEIITQAAAYLKGYQSAEPQE